MPFQSKPMLHLKGVRCGLGFMNSTKMDDIISTVELMDDIISPVQGV